MLLKIAIAAAMIAGAFLPAVFFKWLAQPGYFIDIVKNEFKWSPETLTMAAGMLPFFMVAVYAGIMVGCFTRIERRLRAVWQNRQLRQLAATLPHWREENISAAIHAALELWCATVYGGKEAPADNGQLSVKLQQELRQIASGRQKLPHYKKMTLANCGIMTFEYDPAVREYFEAAVTVELKGESAAQENLLCQFVLRDGRWRMTAVSEARAELPELRELRI